MAKAKEITGLDCDANAVDWAVKVLRVRFDEVCERRDAALNFSDIEGVHAMRVATRRLRSASGDFMPLLQKRPLRRIKKDLKKVAHALGAVRDQDVAIIALKKLQDDAPSEQIKKGVEHFLEERQALREKARIDLTKALTGSNLVLLQANFADSIKPKIKTKHSRTLSFNDAGREAISQSLNDFLKLGESLYAPFAVNELHEFRIAAKQLRYSVELFTACWGKMIEPFAEQIAKMQVALGEVHDCDVWIDALGARLQDEDCQEFQAAIWLLSRFAKKRSSNYLSALKIWSGWKETNFAEAMRSTIASSVD